ncbi:ATP-binding protein [Pantoea sp. A4]|uniref:ATP-binding protein n=1 Tax=Pantoea sp. A4 TaxID=1225184 RepID=UPI001ED9938E|nr:ATP-binding protein [Pantoea sp. A4]
MMRRFFSTMLGQILLIIGCSTLITFTALSTLLFIPKGPPGPPWPWQPTYRIASLVKILNHTPEAYRPAILAASQSDAGLHYALATQPPICTSETFNTWDLAKTLRWELGGQQQVSVASCNAQNPRKDIQVRVSLGDRQLIAMIDNMGREPTRLTFPTLCAMVFLFTGIVVMSVWAIARVISPLREISRHADAFGRELTLMPVKEEGPTEIRKVAHTLNLMQERIAEQMHSRSRMLAAISHDLRTPLTRMRLCLEDTEPTRVREKLVRDIDLMNKLIGSALSFIKTGSDGESAEWCDLDSMITTLCDDYEDAGIQVSYQSADPLTLWCKPDAVQRALTNLIDNAAVVATRITVESWQTEQLTLIEVSDNGPGIPAGLLQKVTEPFYRIDAARQQNRGGAGLGLAIVSDIARLHGGKLELFNRFPQGLTARITLARQGETSPQKL